MQIHKYRLLFLLPLLTLFIFTHAQGAGPVPAPPKVAASGHLLIDFDSGKIISEESADERLEPASLTKIMTAYVVMRELREGNLKLTEEVLVSEKAWRTPGSRMFIEVGKKVSVEKLMMGLIVQSGNDASVALAEHVAGSEESFAGLMNQHAQRLGMDNTHFVNSNGLPAEDHYTTARDMAAVAAATIREFPDYYKWYAVKKFSYNIPNPQYNRNKLLWRDDSVDGLKTGHTEAAGYCLVASAKREDMRLISVVMGTKSENARAKVSQSLLNYGFRFFETHRLYGAGDKLSQVRTWKGDREQVGLGLNRDLFVTIPRKQYKNLKASMSINPQIIAPVSKGSTLGKVTVTLNGENVTEVPLIALESVAEGGIWELARDSALLWLE